MFSFFLMMIESQGLLPRWEVSISCCRTVCQLRETLYRATTDVRRPIVCAIALLSAPVSQEGRRAYRLCACGGSSPQNPKMDGCRSYLEEVPPRDGVRRGGCAQALAISSPRNPRYRVCFDGLVCCKALRTIERATGGDCLQR